MSCEMDFIIPAGGIPIPSDHLHKYTQDKLKALLDADSSQEMATA